VLEHDARARDRLALLRVDIEPDEPGEAEHDLAAARDAAAHQPGVPTLGDDGRARCVAHRQHGRDLGGVGGPHHRARRAVEAAGPVGLVARAQVVVDEHVWGADHLDERVQ
jgi:hypothetical protein